jgi:uncharacterized protein YhaN
MHQRRSKAATRQGLLDSRRASHERLERYRKAIREKSEEMQQTEVEQNNDV